MSNPSSAESVETIKIQRHAYAQGIVRGMDIAVRSLPSALEIVDTEALARKKYPDPPSPPGPRVIEIAGTEYRVVDGAIQFRNKPHGWQSYSSNRAEYIRALYDLLEHPFETAE
jgi:hypothetical protein